MSGGTSIWSTARTKSPQGGTKPTSQVGTNPKPQVGATSKQAPAKKASTSATKRKALKDNGPKKRPSVTPSGDVASRSTSSTPSVCPSSYTIIGVRKPNRGDGKALMRKPAPKGKGSVKMSSQPLRIRRHLKPLAIKRPAGFYESSNEEDAHLRAHP